MASSVIPAESVSEQVVHGVRHPRKRAFLAAYSVTGNIAQAAQAAGVHRTTHYHWVDNDEKYATAFAHAFEVANDLLESEARRRAVIGVEEPVFYGGKLVVDDDGRPITIRRYSDTLLAILLKANRPERFRERASVEHSGPGGGDIPVAVEHRLAQSIREAAEAAGQVIDTTGRELSGPDPQE